MTRSRARASIDPKRTCPHGFRPGALRTRTLHPRATRAFTLMELILSMGLLSLVLGATTAVVSLAARTAPSPDDALASEIALQSVADQIMLDAGDASEIELIGKHEVILTCDDITGDGNPDTIRYAWSGDAGDPLIRSLNGVERVVAEGIQSVSFSGEGLLTQTTGASTTVTRTDQLVASVPRLETSGSPVNVRANAVGQRFRARVPSTATSWSLTSVVLWLARDGLPESTGVVQIWSDDGGVPGTLLTQRTFVELSLDSTVDAETFTFSLEGLDPDSAYWIVVRASFLASPCGIVESPRDIASDHETMGRQSGSSTTWITSSDESLLFEVRGDVELTQPITVIEVRAAALFVNLMNERASATSGARLAHQPLLIADEDAVVDVGASDSLLDAVGDTLDGVLDTTGGLLGGLLGGGGGGGGR